MRIILRTQICNIIRIANKGPLVEEVSSRSDVSTTSHDRLIHRYRCNYGYQKPCMLSSQKNSLIVVFNNTLIIYLLYTETWFY